MNEAYFFGAIFGCLVRDYPATRIIRHFVNKSNFSNSTTVLMTCLIMLLINLVSLYLLGNLSSTIIFPDVLALSMVAYLDMQREIGDSKLIKFLHHAATRWTIGILCLPFLVVMFPPILLLLGYDDVTYIVSLLISLVYCYFIVRKRK